MVFGLHWPFSWLLQLQRLQPERDTIYRLSVVTLSLDQCGRIWHMAFRRTTYIRAGRKSPYYRTTATMHVRECNFSVIHVPAISILAYTASGIQRRSSLRRRLRLRRVLYLARSAKRHGQIYTHAFIEANPAVTNRRSRILPPTTAKFMHMIDHRIVAAPEMVIRLSPSTGRFAVVLTVGYGRWH